MALIGYLIRACVGTAAPGCPVERSSTRFLFLQRKNKRSLAPPDSRGGCPHTGAGVVSLAAGTESWRWRGICIPIALRGGQNRQRDISRNGFPGNAVGTKTTE